MCGIAGYVDFGPATPDVAVLEAMERSLVARGPDAGATMLDGECGLAHRRLSIIDLEHSEQPMRLAGSECSLVFNGEIYNYRELRAQRQAEGHRFVTQGDSEVLLRSVESRGVDAIRELDGMFSFGLWNRRQHRLLLARDPLGIKPLFYAQPRPDLLVFGSEIKALLQHPEISVQLNEDGLRQVLRFRSVYGEATLFAGIRQLAPGSFLQFGRDGVSIGRHFVLEEELANAETHLQGLSSSAQLEYGEQLLTAAVKKRLLADVPVGAFLSGGVDSSLIVALICEIRRQDEETLTFSVGFRDDPHSEVKYAEAVANAVGATNHPVLLNEQDYIALFEPMSVARDAPISEPADLAIARMSQVAKQRVKVVLSGEGADEVFAGYPKYRFARVPSFVSRSIATAGPARLLALTSMLGISRRRARVALTALSQPTALQRMVHWFSYLERTTLAALFPGLRFTESNWQETYASQSSADQRFVGCSSLQRMQAVDCLTWLPGNLLERGDRMTMAAGLEARVPFLDKALVPFGLALADGMKIQGKRMKKPVRQWGSTRLPKEIFQRRKWGFRVPLDEWFRGGMREMLHDTLRAKSGICGTFGDPAAIEDLLRAHDRGDRDANLELWTILSAEVWFQRVVQKSPRESLLSVKPITNP